MFFSHFSFIPVLRVRYTSPHFVLYPFLASTIHNSEAIVYSFHLMFSSHTVYVWLMLFCILNGFRGFVSWWVPGDTQNMKICTAF